MLFRSYVALGAARQAAWALSGAAEPPSWPARPSVTFAAAAAPGVREHYGALRDDAAAWQVSCRPGGDAASSDAASGREYYAGAGWVFGTRAKTTAATTASKPAKTNTLR